MARTLTEGCRKRSFTPPLRVQVYCVCTTTQCVGGAPTPFIGTTTAREFL
jgi:hypothetical protein